ncbi:response regulator [Mesoterricola silvestris]|uniref:Two-component system response regulator n=1 Tax=Mesoterricola silvestris TaxID=2927979 RepID=A0AA48K8R7_9BACT|nr:response regulator [Mesoterricola silvestris]BDU72621.1 two-component system response regulator [Mesoterricola silvestris]
MRILLVDDEPMLLEAFRRSLRVERPGWHVALAGSGEEALAILGRASFDIVVTELLMPGLDGAALLRAVRASSPSTLRVVLSGQPRVDLMEAAEGHFHRFLAKPVDPEILVGVLEELVLDESGGLDERARRFVAGLKGLPSLPSLYARIRSLLAQEDPPLPALVALVQSDLGIASRLLKLVNSAYFSLERRVTDLGQAISMLGLETVKTVVLVRGAMEALQALKPAGLDMNALWRHSQAVATGARSIAAGEGQRPVVLEDAYSLGLLHDMGRVILALDPGADYGRIAEAPGLVAAERRLYGTDHPHVGAQLLSLWGLPQEFCRHIREHHAPTLPTAGFPAGLALYAADGFQEGAVDLFQDGRSDERILAHGDPERPGRWKTFLTTPLPE